MNIGFSISVIISCQFDKALQTRKTKSFERDLKMDFSAHPSVMGVRNIKYEL